MQPISGIQPTSGVNSGQPLKGGQGLNKSSEGEHSFGKLITDFVGQANNDQALSDSSVNDLLSGKTDNIQQVVMAVANAEMSFQLFMEIRNKLLDSYNDLMRMQF